MGQEKTTRELQFQNDILDQMQSNGWLLGQSNKYNRELALYPEDVETFIKQSQPDQWEKLSQQYPSTDRNPDATKNALLKALERHLKDKDYGTLWVLRNQVKDRGAKLNFCAFKPDHDLNPEANHQYQQNILRVVPELIYSLYWSNGTGHFIERQSMLINEVLYDRKTYL